MKGGSVGTIFLDIFLLIILLIFMYIGYALYSNGGVCSI